MTGALESPRVVRDFCRQLAAGLGPDDVVAAAHVLVRRGADRPARSYGTFTACRPGLLADRVSSLAWRVGVSQTASWDFAYLCGYPEVLSGLPEFPLPAETVTRTVAFAEPPLNDDGRPRGGGVPDVSAVMAIPLDLDIGDHGDGKAYCPTNAHGLAFWTDLGPTVIIEVGRGLVALWAFTEPCRDVEAARLLALDLYEYVRELTDERGWDFDSPHPLTMWVRVPGTWSWRSRHLARVVATGERWEFDDLRATVPEFEHHTGGDFYGPEAPWDDRPTPVRPRRRGENRSADRRVPTEGHRSERLDSITRSGGHRRRRT